MQVQLDTITGLVAAGVGLVVGILFRFVSIKRGEKSIFDINSLGAVDVKGLVSKVSESAFKKMIDLIFKNKKKCNFCNKDLPDIAVFCAFCGINASGSMYCQQCQHSLPNDAIVCYKCGNKALEKDHTD